MPAAASSRRGRQGSFTHLVAFALARAATELAVMADHYAEVDGKPARVHDGAVNLGLAVDVEKKDGSRTLMVPVILDAGTRTFDEFIAAYDALVEKARTNTLTADDLVGANVTLTNPGGLGTVASVPRLMPGQGTIVATGSIAYPAGLAEVGEQIGAEKVMTMTSTYDHRVIQGAESGASSRGSARCSAAPTVSTKRFSPRSGSRSHRSFARATPRLRRPRRARRATSCSKRRPPRARSCAPCGRTGTSRRRSIRSAPSRRVTRRSTPSRSA